MWVTVYKSQRILLATQNGEILWRAPIALGREATGPKRREGDGRTPEGVYHICLVKENGKYGRSLGLSYPNTVDARLAFAEDTIDRAALAEVIIAEAEGRRPPWGTALGGEIYLHEGRTDTDWTQGCIALAPQDMARLYACRGEIEAVEILP